ncbi:MAG: transporter substrate-binding domain-containing protein [Desulfamplus sp.]|nr:transporter substrate-binding domain-containing protein [Desulfamplus sp.]
MSKTKSASELQIMMNLSKTDERSEFLNWIGPERMSQMVLVVKEGDESMPITIIDDLAKVAKKQNINFGIQQDFFYGHEFMEKLKNKAFAQYFEKTINAEHNVQKLKVGRILGFFEDQITMRYRIRTDPEYKGLALHGFVINYEPVYFGISKNGISNSTLNKLEQAFTRINNNGTLDKIRNKDW